MELQEEFERAIGEEEKLVKLIAKKWRYRILRELYTNRPSTLTELSISPQMGVDMGNLSRYIDELYKNGVILKQDKKIKIPSKIQDLIHSIIESAKPEEEEPWLPQPDEVKLCLEALEAGDTTEMREAFLSDLRSMLNSGYWDLQLEAFFDKALSHADDVEKEIMEFLNAHPKNPEKIEAFFKREKERIYDLVKRPGDISSAAFRVYVDVCKEKEVLDKIEADLEGEKAEMVIKAVHGYGWPLYEKFGLDFKKFLYKALKHEKEPVRSLALEIMKTISQSRH